jgi:lipopolysaccharide export system protein LptA
MRVTIERLRSGILVLAAALLVGILVFFSYARWQVRHTLRDLPGKLGVEIQQSSEGFTFSKSQGGHTVFTLHAGKTVQYKGNGHARLQDVRITLYGEDGAPADHIYGNDFDYDPVSGVVQANGSVEIDLQMPGASGPSATATAADEIGDKSTVHVKTADLVFNQKTGVASTPQRLEFRLPQAAGTATGATFNSATGLLVLASDVSFASSLNGSPLSVHAHHAQYDRASRLLYLLMDQTEYASTNSSSDQATVYFRPDGSASRMEAKGHVTIVGDEGQRITSEAAHALLDLKSQPQQVVLDGGVLYVSDDPLRTVHGTAATGTLSFGPRATIQKAQLRTVVSIVDMEKPQPQPAHAGPPTSRPYESLTRQIEAGQIDIDFSAGPDRHPVAQHILGTGSASMHVRTLYAATPPEETSIEGDQLLATLQNGVALSSVQGTGHTRLTMLNPSGNRESSTGDRLLLTFADLPANAEKPGKPKHPAAAPRPGRQIQSTQIQSNQLESSEQTGNVVLVQTIPSQPPAPARTTTALAQRATYDATTQLLRLYGSPEAGDPRIRDANGEVTAETIEFERTSGDATATGQVKATYRQSPAQPGVSFGGAEPVHVVADRAHLDHATDLTTFYGNARDARLWQGADSIAAPVIEISRSSQTLEAHGLGGSDAKAVSAVLTTVQSGSGQNQKPTTPGSPATVSVVRVSSRSLIYSDAENKAVFRGGVVAQAPSGTVRSSVMSLYFTETGSASPGSKQSRPDDSKGKDSQDNHSKQVERIVAEQGVNLEQPGRKGTGEQLVYTASDGHFVLTGTSSLPPHIFDQVHGTVTGTSLIFNDRDDSVIVSGGQSKAVTETRTSK